MSQAQQFIEELDRLVGKEIEAYQQLLECQQAEKRLLVARSLEPFVTNLQAKEHLTRTIAQLEHTRQDVAARLAPLLGLPASAMSLQQLSTRVDAPYADRFLHYRARLRELVSHLQRCNHENARLLQDSLAIINEALAFFACLTPASPTYHASGTFMHPTQGRLLSGRV
jgi:flagellar biosynthesis/type III secretory pathway chaperone